MNSFLEQTYYNNTLQDWLISLLILTIAFVISALISTLRKRFLKPLAERTSNYYDNILVSTLKTPLKVGIILIGIWVALRRLELGEAFSDGLYKSYQILTVLNITWFVVHLINGILVEYFAQKKKKQEDEKQAIYNNKHYVQMLRKIVTAVLWTVGIITALNNVGLSLTAILGALGLSGIAIALASQDTVKNIFGGFTIFTDSTFKIGDYIKIGEFEGSVEDIGIRSTKIKNKDRQIVTIPNFKIVEGAVTNISVAKGHRVSVKINLEQSTHPDKIEELMEILKQIAKDNSNISKLGTAVSFNDIGASIFGIEFSYYIVNHKVINDTLTAVNLEIIRKLSEANIKYKFDSASSK